MHLFLRCFSVASGVGSASRCFLSVFFVFFDACFKARFVSPMYVFLHAMDTPLRTSVFVDFFVLY